MTPKERVYTTLDHKEPDRVPFGELAIDYDITEKVLGRESFLRAKFKETKALWDGRRDEVVESQKQDVVDLARKLEMDIVTVFLVPSEDAEFKPMKKIDEETYEDEKGNLYRISVRTEALRPYKMKTDDYVEPKLEDFVYEEPERPDDSCFELIRWVKKELGETHFIAVRTGDIGWPHVGRDEEEALINLLRKPGLVKKAAEVTGRRVIVSLKYFAEEGVDAVFPAADYGHNLGPMASPQIFREVVFPWLKAYCEEAHKLGLKVIKHACGNNWLLMDMFVEAGYDAYQAIQASATMDIKRLKEKYGDKLTLWGGVNTENLVGGTPEDIERDALYALKYAAPGGGYIYGSSHSVAIGTKYENFMRMLEVLRKKGTYPIKL